MRKIYIVLIALGIFGVWAGSGWAINTWINASYRGTFGDMFGAVNALFSGLAFAGLIYTISVQRDELQEQKKAIEMQTEELALQRQAIEMQTEELKMQREETARSADQLEGQKNLLNLQMAMSVVNDLIQTKNKRLEEIINFLPRERLRGYNAISDLIKTNGHDGSYKITEDENYLQGYLNTIFFILKFIQSYDLQNDQKDMLSNLVIMNSTDDEVKLIYVAVAENQHRLMMLKVHGFYPRYKKITESETMPS
ncbi:hypothetical protein [Paenibacillus sp. S25]|uniref:hypothetical protein n=1 Tax=unclassified Paenibacillus TaxID=185978 RepID=UPI001C6487C8|nr:hypothetical protein [Paenibacillus sp. S25]QYK62452.1 hypothetical protein KAI37_02782 [Paenibacillus sp. S25]